jgi:hypothetical protein
VGPTALFHVDWISPSGMPASSLTAQVGYRWTHISLPGSGQAPMSRVTNTPPNSSFVAIDEQYAVFVLVSAMSPATIAPGRLFDLGVDRCVNASLTSADLDCLAIGCLDASGQPIPCSCVVTQEPCCTARQAPLCGANACEQCICAFDPFCCNFFWDALCAQEAQLTQCSPACGC